MGHGRAGGPGAIGWRLALSLAGAVLGSGGSFPGVAVAMHEADHRFAVEGHVCGPDGQPVADAQVFVKDQRDQRVSGTTVYTDRRGRYKAVLHLHNDNRGDPILVTAGDKEQRITAQFDAKDHETERKAVVHFGAGCESAGGPEPWMYGVGIGVLAVAVFAGARLMRRQRRSQVRGKGQRK